MRQEEIQSFSFNPTMFSKTRESIPKILHNIWFQGCDAIPSKYINNVNGLKKNHKTWEYKCWNENRLRSECLKYSKECLYTFDNYEHMHQKIDFGKYVILYNYGGAYVDIDCVSLKALDTLPGFSTKDLIVSYNAANILENFVITYGMNYDSINNGVILSSPKNKYMYTIIQELMKIGNCQHSSMKSLCIHETTGPAMFTNIILNNFEKDPNILILDNVYLEPCFAHDIQCKISSKSYINHVHEGSWLDKRSIDIAKAYYIFKFFAPYILFIILILYIKIKLKK